MADTYPRPNSLLGVQLQPVEFDPFALDVPGATIQRLALTSSQREVFAALQMSPDASAAFNLCNFLRLEGPLDVDALRRALQGVVDRHAALRTSFAADGSYQEIHPSVSVVLEHETLHQVSAEAGAEALRELAAHKSGLTLDTAAPPLWRARLLSWGDDSHGLIFNAHHLISDGWSSSVLFDDLAKAYAAEVEGVPPAWPECLSFESFVLDQLSLETAAREKSDLAYWQAMHQTPAAPLALPLDHPRPPLKTYACRNEQLVLEPELSKALRAMGARHGCTLFVTLLAAFQAWLARVSGQSDIVVGVPIALQTQLENAHMVADGANTLPLRQAVNVDWPFSEQLKASRRGLLDAHAHQFLSFGNLVRTMQLPRDPSRTPLVDVIFNLDRSQPLSAFGPARVVSADSAKVFSNTELTVDVVDDGEQLAVNFRYLAALFKPATIRRWLDGWQAALVQLAADPTLALAQAFEPTGSDLAALKAFNGTAHSFSAPYRLEALVAQQAQRTPRQPALWSNGHSVSYGQLDEMANGVAYALQAEGVLPGDRVGLIVGRDAHMVAGVLGILKAGAAYVPLDSAYPADRLAYMAADAGLRWILCDAQTEVAGVCLGRSSLRLDRCPPRAQAPSVSLGTQDTAYVIYTSGSTGKPKGVELTHKAVVNFIRGVQSQIGMLARERHAAVAMLSFDMSVMDLFLPLSVGASVVLVPREELQDGSRLQTYLEGHGATSLQAAPSIWQLLLDAGWSGTRNFRAFSGGEPLSPELARNLQSRCKELWNLYGPTEAAVYATMARVDAQTGPILVGSPMANVEIHLLDDRLRPVPLGAVGEICISGEGLARGYLNRPELTAERFVSDPREPARRLYRTGDLGRWHLERGLECLGRTDHQLKLRGWRIEPGEIESCLLALPGVKQALVQAHDAGSAHASLRAYVVCKASEFDARALRSQLRQQLPEVMVPAQVIRLDALPLLPNGKINRLALAEVTSAEAPAEVEATLSPAEQKVADIWCGLLGIRHVLPQDNFFDLGGHSLLAAKAAQEMSQALGFKVEVPRLVMENLSQVVKRAIAQPEAASGERAAAARLSTWLKRWTSGVTGS